MRITDTRTQQKQEVAPGGDEVLLYVCGVTPYAEAHIGHAMSYIVFDVLRRFLEFRGFTVRHVQNFTDIDDKLIDRARLRGTTVEALAEQYIAEYFRDMDELNIKRATVYPRATQEVPQIIAMVQGLIERGYAYQAGGDVFYRVRKKENYGELKHQDLDELLAGARIEIDEQKEFAGDFALWKGAKPGEPSWESPWGPGRPGWHIECSAMSLRYLGPQIDIHGGGEDLIFPHHTNEIAQTEAFTGVRPFARIWMHNAHLRLGGEKMSKSLGNILSIRDALDRWGADALRAFVLGSHYRTPLTATDEALNAAKRGAERLRTAARAEGGAGSGEPLDPASWREEFIAALDDDLNTPRALAALFDLGRAINRGREEAMNVVAAQQELRELAGVLGLTLEESAAAAPEAAPFIDLLVDVRRELRAAKQYALADSVRSRLQALGVTLEDGPQGTTWRMG
ncbi:MAG TPA: cysteine--tRNA ligase [Dehalococcoidia bacterium]|nr:cysteine--tRNA ligase [Dehalococcoidia bacterium]